MLSEELSIFRHNELVYLKDYKESEKVENTNGNKKNIMWSK